jgi:DNA mismatch repair protein MutL
MPTIQVLPQTLINQIAAGEVVVRMASVAKELVDNALDAGASRVTVEVANQVLDLIVTDDGIGMDRADAELSLQRHATSKIRTIEDLFALGTRGFRGEALASIAAVSRMELRTRRRGRDEGTRIVVEGGRIERIEPCGCPEGTRVAVRDLFFNTPARLKFLKSPASELTALTQMLVRMALAAPEVAMRLERDGEALLDLPASADSGERFAAVLGSALTGALEPMAFTRGDVMVHGHIAPLECTRADRRLQWFYVNGRRFQSRSIGAALEQAFEGFVMAGRHPIALAFIDLPPEHVDFNVHPTKDEVRFRNERDVAGSVYHAAREAAVRASTRGRAASLGAPAPPPVTAPPAADAPYRPPDYFTSPSAAARAAFERKHQVSVSQRDWLGEAQRLEAAAVPAAEFAPAAGPPITARHGDDTLIAAGPGERPDPSLWSSPDEPEPIGQIANTYIVARLGNDLLLVDQHASHERLVYLDLVRRAAPSADAQMLLVPVVIEPPATQLALVREHRDAFAAIGIELEEFGPRSWAVRSVPGDLAKADIARMVLDILGDFEESGRGGHALDRHRDRILIRAACHGAIRAGEPLDLDRMRALLRQMKAERLSFTCPHGRPTVIRLSKGELDRMFKRIV